MAKPRRSAPRRIWSRPTSASSSPSPRNTSTADFISWTSSKRAISASCAPPTSSNTAAVTSFRPTPPGGSAKPSPRPSAAIPADDARLRRILRHPLFQRHDPAAPDAQHRNHRRARGPGDLDAALHPAGARVHRALQKLALLPLYAAHVSSHSAGGVAALPRAFASRLVRRRGGGTRLERRRSPGQTQARGPRQSDAGDVLLGQRTVVSGQSRPVARAQRLHL